MNSMHSVFHIHLKMQGLWCQVGVMLKAPVLIFPGKCRNTLGFLRPLVERLGAAFESLEPCPSSIHPTIHPFILSFFWIWDLLQARYRKETVAGQPTSLHIQPPFQGCEGKQVVDHTDSTGYHGCLGWGYTRLSHAVEETWKGGRTESRRPSVSRFPVVRGCEKTQRNCGASLASITSRLTHS